MPGFANLRSFVSARVDDGKERYTTWRKSPTQATLQGVWFDLSMMPGNPVPNYYASTPLVSAVLNGNEGIFHGGNVAPGRKRLARLMALCTTATPLPMSMILLDYLLYYPFVDQGVSDDQFMINSTPLPRYTDGQGVKVMAVMTNPQQGSFPTFNFTYTNQDGVNSRTSQTVTCGATTIFGSLINTATATAGASQHFIGLQAGDTGVRQIDSFRIVSGTDVGLICLVLVKPIANIMIRGIDAPVEVEYLRDSARLPEIYDGAYLNFICCPNGSLSGVAIHGDAIFIWD